MKEELRVRYNIEAGIDSKLDVALTELLKEHGWHFWASGYSFKTGRRGLAFDCEEFVTDTST